jgi:hypothetical protein
MDIIDEFPLTSIATIISIFSLSLFASRTAVQKGNEISKDKKKKLPHDDSEKERVPYTYTSPELLEKNNVYNANRVHYNTLENIPVYFILFNILDFFS